MYKIITEISDLFIPRLCSGCNKKLSTEEEFICPSCIISMNLAKKEKLSLEYKKNFASQRIIEDFTSLYLFEKDRTIQDVIHSIKYRNKFRTASFLGRLAGLQFSELLKEWDINTVIPVPLHPVKKAERGYNQSYHIAKGLCKPNNIILDNRILKRVKYTETQTAMTISEREKNISGAFKLRTKIANCNYLLVDDVITTGATIRECARVLKEKGADKVYALSLAIAD